MASNTGRQGEGMPVMTAAPMSAAHTPARRRYIGLLATETARRLQRIVRPFGIIIEARRPEVWLEALNGPAHICAIVDPAQLAPADLEMAIARLRQHPRPAVVYADASAEGVSRAMRIVKETGAAAMFQSHHESATLLARTIVAAAPPGDAAMLLARLEPGLARLPDELQSAITTMFAAAAAPESPELVAERAGLSRRSLDRWLARGGFPSARLLIATPSMLRAFRLLKETDIPLHMVARITGMRSAPRLRHSALELVGLRPIQIRTEPHSMAELINTAAAALRGVPADPRADPRGHER